MLKICMIYIFNVFLRTFSWKLDKGNRYMTKKGLGLFKIEINKTFCIDNIINFSIRESQLKFRNLFHIDILIHL